MKHTLCLLLSLFVFLFSCTRESSNPVNPNATKEARKLLQFLYEIQGRYILSGQHNFIATGSKYSEIIKEMTGKYPIVWGSDFSFCYEGDEPFRFQHCGPLNLSDPGSTTSAGDATSRRVSFTDLDPHEARQNMVEHAIEKHKEGFIITLMWHACPPGLGDCCNGTEIWTMENRPSQEEWDELTTEGTPLNITWKQHADTIAFYLKQLQYANVPVLWRPYHEMNGVWFWWCNKKGENGFKKLWIMMYNYYVNHHKLDNLIWVWNTNAPRDIPGDEAFAYEAFWPGPEYVDVLAADVYRGDWKQSHHDDLLALADGKPIALGECAPPPNPELLATQNHWTWFMPWGNLVLWGNGPEIIKELMDNEKVLTKDDVIIDKNGNYEIIRKEKTISGYASSFNEEKQKLMDEMDQSLRDELLDAWYPATIDSVYGGFLSDFTYDWQPEGPQNKMIVTQTRQVWTASKAAVFLHDDRYREIAEHGFRFLKDKMWDSTSGGFYTLCNREGEVVQSTFGDNKSVYGNAFAIYALTAYHETSGDPQALHLARETFLWLDKHCHDPQYGGYFSRFIESNSASGNTSPIMNSRDFGRNGWKDQNSSIHLLEAFTDLYQVWPDSLLRHRLFEMLQLIRDTITTDKGCLTLNLERDWTPVSFRDSSNAVRRANYFLDHVSFGHDIETAYLMLEAAHVLGLDPDTKTLTIAKKMVDHALARGWDEENGGFYYQGYYFENMDSISIISDVKTWWVQAEGLNVLLLMSQLFPEKEAYYQAFKKQWEYINKYLIDHEHGGWYEEGLDKSPEQTEAPKAKDWKVNYHNMRALMNCINRLKS